MTRRRPTGHLRDALTEAGIEARCAVVGCCAKRLGVHHVQPVVTGGTNAASNLAYLCADHHALIERFYWWSRSQMSPETCKQITAIARAFSRMAVPPEQVEPLQTESRRLWAKLNAQPESVNPLWWRVVYLRALKWAQHQQVLRTVAPERAIIEDPWFRDRRGITMLTTLESEEFLATS